MWVLGPEHQDAQDIDGWNWWRRVMMGGRWDNVSGSRRERHQVQDMLCQLVASQYGMLVGKTMGSSCMK